jgi:hypothetical protein
MYACRCLHVAAAAGFHGPTSQEQDATLQFCMIWWSPAYRQTPRGDLVSHCYCSRSMTCCPNLMLHWQFDSV